MTNPKIPTPAVCPRCGCWYQAGVKRCLDDGSALLQADNMVRMFGPEDMSSQHDTIVEVVIRGSCRPHESLGQAAARLKGGPSTMLMEQPGDEELEVVASTDDDREPPTRLVPVDTGARPWVPLDPSDFEVPAQGAPRRSVRWPRQPPGRERVGLFEVPTRPDECVEVATEIVVARGASSELARMARRRRVTRHGYAVPAGRRTGDAGRTPGLTQHTPTLLRQRRGT